jgi:hypothetical protein
MDLTIISPDATPEWARPMHERISTLAEVDSSSASSLRGEAVAWAVAAKRGEGLTLVAAVAKTRPELIVAMLSTAHPLEAMAMVRSLVHRSGKRAEAGGLVAAHFGDLVQVRLAVRAPQFCVRPASELGDLRLAVACTWEEMAVAPSAREAVVRARAVGGVSGEVLSPPERALAGIGRALRKANEPLASNAAWAMQSLMREHHALVRARLEELVLTKDLSDDRRELLGALVDELNPILLASLPPGPRAVVGSLRLRARIVVAFFYLESEADRSQLAERHPEQPMAKSEAAAGFALLGRVFDQHRTVIEQALGRSGEFRLRRGFHADVTLAEALASFAADGFVPARLVLDA